MILIQIRPEMEVVTECIDASTCQNDPFGRLSAGERRPTFVTFSTPCATAGNGELLGSPSLHRREKNSLKFGENSFCKLIMAFRDGNDVVWLTTYG